MRFLIGEFEIDLRTRRISGPSGNVHVEPQVFDVLAHLATHRDRAVAKTELLDEIWGDQFVSESALASRIRSGRAALADNGRDQRVIRTVHGFGYQLVADVDIADVADADAPTPRPTPDRWTTPLPSFHTPLRGREDDLTRVDELVERHQLVTLLGPGGTGKTRLSVEVLQRRIGDERSPAFVDLASTREADAVPATIAAALGIDTGQRSDPLDAACEYLSADPHFVVVDNCEHVIGAAAEAVATIASRAATTTIIATSREPLGVSGEQLYRLSPLPVVESSAVDAIDDLRSYPATALFLDRAQLAGDDVELSDDDASLVARLCRELDGLPLAIELAAGRMSAFDLDDLVNLLDRRLDALGDRSVSRDDRHRTLRATVGWSYDLLSEPERRLFRALAALPGGVALEGIDWMSGRLGLGIDGIDAAARLVDASLLIRRRTASGSRYSMLETLRTFGIDQLAEHGESDAIADLVTEYTSQVVASIDPGLDTDDEAVFADRLQRELPNVRAARSRLIELDRLHALTDLCAHLARWSRMRTASEVWSWYDDLVARLPADDQRRPMALALHAQAAWRRGDIAAARRAATTAHDEADDDTTRSLALWELGAALLFDGDLDNARRAWIECSALRHDGTALASAAVAAAYAGDVEGARAHIADGRRGAAMPATAASWLDYCEAETENTVGRADPAVLERSIERAEALDCSFVVGVATVTLATVLEQRGDVAGAAIRYRDLISHWLRAGGWTQQWTTLRHVAALIEESSPDTALLVLHGAAADTASASALIGPAADRLRQLERRLHTRLDDDTPPPATRVEIAERARAALTLVIEHADADADA